MTTFEEEKKFHVEMSCADNPFFPLPPIENYQLDIAFAFSQITWQEQIPC